MNLLQLEYFHTVAVCEHMTRAARQLHISQPTLSQVIARLEDELGVRLFDRKGRHIQLNEHGKLLLERTNYILKYIDETKKELMKDSVREDPNIYIRMYVGHYLFADIFTQFQTLHPFVRFHLLFEDNDAIDALSIQYVGTLANTFNGCYLLDDEIVLLTSEKADLAGKRSIDLMELKDRNFIANETGFLKEITQPYCEKAGFLPHFSYMVKGNREMTALIRLNYGIACWPSKCLSELELDGISILKIRRPLCIRSLCIAYPKKRPLTDMEQKFTEFASEYFQE